MPTSARSQSIPAFLDLLTLALLHRRGNPVHPGLSRPSVGADTTSARTRVTPDFLDLLTLAFPYRRCSTTFPPKEGHFLGGLTPYTAVGKALLPDSGQEVLSFRRKSPPAAGAAKNLAHGTAGRQPSKKEALFRREDPVARTGSEKVKSGAIAYCGKSQKGPPDIIVVCK